MQTYLKLHPNGVIGVVQLRGRINIEDLLDLLNENTRPAAMKALDALITDLSAVTDVALDFQQMTTLAGHADRAFANRDTPMRSAYYAPSDLSFGMARMYETLASMRPHLDVRVFRARQECADWAGMSIEELWGAPEDFAKWPKNLEK